MIFDQHIYATDEFEQVSRSASARHGYQTVAMSSGVSREFAAAIESNLRLGAIPRDAHKHFASNGINTLYPFGTFCVDDRTVAWRARVDAERSGCRPWSYFVHSLIVDSTQYCEYLDANPFSLLRSGLYLGDLSVLVGNDIVDIDRIEEDPPTHTLFDYDEPFPGYLDTVGEQVGASLIDSISEDSKTILVTDTLVPSFLEAMVMAVPMRMRRGISFIAYPFAPSEDLPYKLTVLHHSCAGPVRKRFADVLWLDAKEDASSDPTHFARLAVDFIRDSNLGSLREMLRIGQQLRLDESTKSLSVAANVMEHLNDEINGPERAAEEFLKLGHDESAIREALNYYREAITRHSDRKDVREVIRVYRKLCASVGIFKDHGLVSEFGDLLSMVEEFFLSNAREIDAVELLQFRIEHLDITPGEVKSRLDEYLEVIRPGGNRKGLLRGGDQLLRRVQQLGSRVGLELKWNLRVIELAANAPPVSEYWHSQLSEIWKRIQDDRESIDDPFGESRAVELHILKLSFRIRNDEVFSDCLAANLRHLDQPHDRRCLFEILEECCEKDKDKRRCSVAIADAMSGFFTRSRTVQFEMWVNQFSSRQLLRPTDSTRLRRLVDRRRRVLAFGRKAGMAVLVMFVLFLFFVAYDDFKFRNAVEAGVMARSDPSITTYERAIEKCDSVFGIMGGTELLDDIKQECYAGLGFLKLADGQLQEARDAFGKAGPKSRQYKDIADDLVAGRPLSDITLAWLAKNLTRAKSDPRVGTVASSILVAQASERIAQGKFKPAMDLLMQAEEMRRPANGRLKVSWQPLLEAYLSRDGGRIEDAIATLGDGLVGNKVLSRLGSASYSVLAEQRMAVGKYDEAAERYKEAKEFTDGGEFDVVIATCLIKHGQQIRHGADQVAYFTKHLDGDGTRSPYFWPWLRAQLGVAKQEYLRGDLDNLSTRTSDLLRNVSVATASKELNVVDRELLNKLVGIATDVRDARRFEGQKKWSAALQRWLDVSKDPHLKSKAKQPLMKCAREVVKSDVVPGRPLDEAAVALAEKVLGDAPPDSERDELNLRLAGKKTLSLVDIVPGGLSVGGDLVALLDNYFVVKSTRDKFDVLTRDSGTKIRSISGTLCDGRRDKLAVLRGSSLAVYDMRTGASVGPVWEKDEGRPLRGVHLDPRSKTVIAWSEKKIQVHALDGGALLTLHRPLLPSGSTPLRFAYVVKGLAFSPDRVLTVCDDGDVWRLDRSESKPVVVTNGRGVKSSRGEVQVIGEHHAPLVLGFQRKRNKIDCEFFELSIASGLRVAARHLSADVGGGGVIFDADSRHLYVRTPNLIRAYDRATLKPRWIFAVADSIVMFRVFDDGVYLRFSGTPKLKKLVVRKG